MLKTIKQVDISESILLISFTSVGLTGNFASSLLINNNSFENIGFFFSHYLSAYVGFNPQTNSPLYNGQVYFSKDKKITLLNFHAGVAHHFRNEFANEILKMFNDYKMKKIIIYGGIGKDFLNDEELRNPNVDVYYLTNDEQFDGKLSNIKNFETLVKIEDKKKPLEEVKYLDKVGIAKHLVKFLTKKNVNFIYLFAYSSELFDPIAALAVFYKLKLVLGLSNENVVIPKNGHNLNEFLDKIEKNYKFEQTWKLFLNE